MTTQLNFAYKVIGDQKSELETLRTALCASRAEALALKSDASYSIATETIRQLRAEVEGLRALGAHAEGKISHINRGLCPDEIEGCKARDPNCEVCSALTAMENNNV